MARHTASTRILPLLSILALGMLACAPERQTLQGLTGAVGPKGSDGLDGPEGDPGPTGAPGTQFTLSSAPGSEVIINVGPDESFGLTSWCPAPPPGAIVVSSGSCRAFTEVDSLEVPVSVPWALVGRASANGLVGWECEGTVPASACLSPDCLFPVAVQAEVQCLTISAE